MFEGVKVLRSQGQRRNTTMVDVMGVPAAAQADEVDVFTMIAHPVRRALLDLLAAPGAEEQAVKHLAAPFDVSRPAISQHLALLLAAGLVSERKVGRERHYRLRATRLQEVYAWVARYQRFWDEKLDALGQYLDEAAGAAEASQAAKTAETASDTGGTMGDEATP